MSSNNSIQTALALSVGTDDTFNDNTGIFDTDSQLLDNVLLVLWYSFSATTDSFLNLWLQSTFPGDRNSSDSILRVYDASLISESDSSIGLLYSDDDSGLQENSFLSFSAVAGTNYIVMVGIGESGPTLPINFSLSASTSSTIRTVATNKIINLPLQVTVADAGKTFALYSYRDAVLPSSIPFESAATFKVKFIFTRMPGAYIHPFNGVANPVTITILNQDTIFSGLTSNNETEYAISLLTDGDFVELVFDINNSVWQIVDHYYKTVANLLVMPAKFAVSYNN